MSAREQPYAESCIDGWKGMYVSGTWTLGEFEAHLEAMLPTFTLDDWLPRKPRPKRVRTAKQAAESWSAAAERSAASYAAGAQDFRASIQSGGWTQQYAKSPGAA